MSPLDEFADFEVSLGMGSPGNRGAYRMRIAGLEARVGDFEELFAISDISATGCCMVVPEALRGRLRTGRALSMSLLAGQKSLLTAITAKIIRVLPNGTVACSFRGLAVEQEAVLDKLILETQKVAIRRRK